MALTQQQWDTVYKQYQADTAGARQGNESAAGAPSFRDWASGQGDLGKQAVAELGPYGDPWQASQAGYGSFPSMFKSSGGGFFSDLLGGIKNIASAAALPAAVSVGLPALLSGGANWGIGSGLAANAAGAGAAGAASAPADLSMVNLPAQIGAGAANAPADLGMVNLPSITDPVAQNVLATGAGIGAGAAGALGVAGLPSLGAAGATPSAAPAAVAGGAGGAGGGAAAAPAAAGATGAVGGAAPAAAAGGAAATTPQTFMDSLLGQFKKNALSLGIMGLGLAGAASTKTPMPGESTLTGLGQSAAGVAQQYLDAAKSGTLTAPQQAQLDQYTQQAKNQVRQYFASIGQFDSSARMQAEAQVDQTAMAMKEQLIQQTLAGGLQALGAAQGPLATVAQYQLGQDNALKQALGQFATGAGLLAGTQAGTKAATP